MGGPLRSKQGCWTCRLRKKKCDEGHPQCTVCEELSIPCYGFGSKPEWMNGGVEEKAVAHSLKEIVKHTWRRKGASHSTTQRDLDPVIDRAPTPPIVSVEDSFLGQTLIQHDATPLLDYGSSQRVEFTQNGSPRTILSISADESALLMHFLDKMFSLQFPVYNPGIQDGGRGWLLSLLLRTKPLYHAALALSACHRRMIVLASLQQPCRAAALVQQEEQLQSCIQSLNQFVQNCHPNNGLGVATSVVQLMFFELFTGFGNVWQAHLHAALDMLSQAHRNNLTKFGLAEKSNTILCEDLSLSEYDPEVAEEVTNFRFLVGTTTWLDITASITMGTTPNLLPYHSRFLATNSQTKLEDIMGCKNWVMLQIGRVAVLYQNKLRAIREGHSDCPEVERTVLDIAREIHCSLNQETFESFDISEHDFSAMFDASDTAALVTQIFAYMALAYLHLVSFGFQRLEELDIIISRAMKVLRTSIPRSLLPALVSPLFIFACVTEQEDIQFFRNLFSSFPLLDPFLRHRGGILLALEEIWRRRRTTPGFAWEDCLRLTGDLLLL